jgi:positive regulator of sigma E activity
MRALGYFSLWFLVNLLVVLLVTLIANILFSSEVAGKVGQLVCFAFGALSAIPFLDKYDEKRAKL